MAMKFKDRVKGFRRVKASLLKPHPRNPRSHPESQRAALRKALGEIGWTDVLIVREMPDKSLQIIDGHLRADQAGDAKVPVIVVDLEDHEVEIALATHDPIGAMAEFDKEVFGRLLAQLHDDSPAVEAVLDHFSRLNVIDLFATLPDEEDTADESDEGTTGLIKCPKCGHSFSL